MSGIIGRNGQGNDSHSVFVLDGEETVTGVEFPNRAYAYSGTTTNTGAAKSSTIKFGANSWYFDTGLADYMTVPYDAGRDFGANCFTIDFWYRPAALAVSYQGVLDTITGDVNNGFAIRFRTAPYGLQFFEVIGVLQSNVSIPVAAFPANTYVHCAFVRTQAGLLSAYADGILQDSDSSTSVISSAADMTVNLTTFEDWYEDYGATRIDGMRISKGVARWTTNFTPPARAYV